MDDIRQSRIDHLNYCLTRKKLITESAISIFFFDAIANENGITGKILIDHYKTGDYNIFFADKLTLILISTSNFKFSNFQNMQLNSIAIEGIDTDAIINLTRNLIITKI